MNKLIGLLGHRIAGNLIITFSTSSALQIMSIFTGILTARMLGPTGKGALTAIVLWPGILSLVGSFGIAEAINYFSASSNENLKGKILGTGIYIGFTQIIVLLFIGWLSTPLVLGRQDSALIIYGRYYLLFIPLNILTLYHQAYLAGSMRFGAYNLGRFSVSLSILVGLMLLATSGKASVINVLIVYLIANLIVLIVTITSVYIPKISGFGFDRYQSTQMLTYGFKAQASSVTMMVNERIDQLAIMMLLPVVQLGYYAVSVSITSAVLIIGTSIAMVAMPVVARTIARNEQIQLIALLFRVNFWISMIVGVFLIVAAPYLIIIFFGSEYLPAEIPTKILLVAAIPLSTNRVLQASLKAVNLPMQAGFAELIAAVLTIIFLIILLPIFGIEGAAITSLLAYSISCIYMMWVIINKVGCSPRELFTPRFADYENAKNLMKSS